MIKNISSLVLIFIITYAVIIIFQQNLLISSSFPILPMREVDDFAFQHSINKLHIALSNFDFVKFFSCNDYGYGSIFWILNAIISYPGYLVQNDQLIIISPRMLSLFFGVLSLFYVYKISKKYTSNLAIQLSVPTVLVLMPEFAFMCLRFHTHSQLLFFSVLCFYFATNYRDESFVIRKILFAMALAIGTKINALILVIAIAPICLILYKDKNNGNVSYKAILKYIIFTSFFTILFYNPLIILFPIFTSESYEAIRMLFSHIYYSGINPGHLSNEYLMNLLENGLFKNYAGYLTLPLSIISLITGYVLYRDKNFSDKNLPYILIFMSLSFLIAATVLLFRVKNGPWSYANYIIPLIFPIIFSSIIIDRIPGKAKYFALSCFIFIIFSTNKNNIEEFYYRYENQKYSDYNKARMENYKNLENIIKPSAGKKTRVLTDFNVLIPVSNIDKNYIRSDFFNNFASFNNKYDYIIISKNNVIFDEKEDITRKFSNSKPYLLGKEKYSELSKNGLFNGLEYKIILENNTIVVFGTK